LHHIHTPGFHTPQITILGAGYIALEFAGIFHRFGTETHVAFRAPLPLRGFDEEVRGWDEGGFASLGFVPPATNNSRRLQV
jgi:glutathione reductase (NADPH)